MELRIPPPVQALFFATLMWFVDDWTDFVKVKFAFQGLIALVISFIGLSCIGLAGLNFKSAETTVNPLKPSNASSLVVSGIYKVSRNPMYLGLLIILSAWFLYLGNFFTLVVLPVFVWYITNFQIKPEEEALRKIFSQEYENYCSQVRRWI